MADTKILVRKATALLREDHEKVKKLLSEAEGLAGGSGDKKAKLFKRIKEELTVHATIEEEIFYPAVEGVQKGTKEGEDIVNEAKEEHKIVKTLLAEMSALNSTDETFDAKMKVLKESVEHHAEEEQEDMFPLFDELDKEEQNRVSERLMARKGELASK